MKTVIASLACIGGLVSGLAAEPKAADSGAASADVDWVHVEKDVWAILADEPEHHLNLAKAAYTSGDKKEAAANVRIASELLDQRQQVLEAAQEKLDAMASSIESDRLSSVKELDKAIAGTLASLSGDGVWYPTAVMATRASLNEPAYHMDRAKQEFAEKDYKAAAIDIRKAAVFMKLNSENAGASREKPAVQREAADLQSLADRVASGKVKDSSQLDRAFKEAGEVLQKAA